MKRRGGLGSFLLKGFKRRRVPRAARVSVSRRPVSRKRNATRQPSRQLAPQLPASPPSQPTPSPQTAHLTTTELLQPDQKLKDSIEGFLLDQRSEHTRRAYGKDLKRFLKFLLVRRLERGEGAIDRHLLVGYKDFLLSEGLEHTTIDRHLATLRSFFGWLVEDGRIDRNPAEKIRFLNPKKVSRTIGFTDEEVVKVLTKPDPHRRTGAQHHAILAVLFYCGLRRSELCALRTSNLSVERGQPVFKILGKGNAERMIVLTPTVWKAIQHYLTISRKDPKKDQYLFSPFRNNRTGELDKAMDPSMIFYIVTRYARQAGVANRVSPHSCRATAISNARDHQVSDRAIQEFAGWASPDMITRYDKRKSAIEKSAAHAIRYGAEEPPAPH